MLRARLDEDGGALLHGDPLALHLEYAAPLEHDVDLVVLVRLLAVRLRREIRGEWLLILSGALSVLFGLVLVVWPATGALAVIYLIGIYAIVFGAALLMLAFRLRRLGRGDVVAGTHRPATA